MNAARQEAGYPRQSLNAFCPAYDPQAIIAAAKRGHQTLETIH
jgi:hypothetical protein